MQCTHLRTHPHCSQCVPSYTVSLCLSSNGARACRRVSPALSRYFEKMVKSDRRPSLWLKNIQLALYGTIVAAVGLVIQQDPLIGERGLFYGFNGLVYY